ncbi:hypothetical protein DP939_32340 [Spongiactinospora rosea]|uniref:Trypsin-co-occurring domain-containing protein n=1 Tax=Spongiactinospora rosea TaxID=2248750 RepID=A0A366LQA6_9ACTN|nr:trypco2 family protein [Spongiactinospora rosea]RBQ16007.1 hypothetical protein DP939_32340 [Spongiactinospora rosea]
MIELSRVVQELRGELTKAMQAAEGEPLRFGVGPVELEVTMVITREEAAGGKVRFWVLEAGADAKETDERTHRVTLTLTPEFEGGPMRVGGAAEEGED